jgi:hypothetical protein
MHYSGVVRPIAPSQLSENAPAKDKPPAMQATSAKSLPTSSENQITSSRGLSAETMAGTVLPNPHALLGGLVGLGRLCDTLDDLLFGLGSANG